MDKTQRSRAQWRAVIERQQTSGLGVAAFCRRAGVPESSFYAWRLRLREEGSFAELRVAPPVFEHRSPQRVAGADQALELWLPRDRRLVVRPGFDRATLIDLLALLECDTCCTCRR